MTLGEQLCSGLSSNGKLPPNAEDFKRMEALYRKDDKDGLEKEAETWPSSHYGCDQLFKKPLPFGAGIRIGGASTGR